MEPLARAKVGPMKLADVIETLKSKGKPSHVKTYRRHGLTGEAWGVPYADLGKLEKQLRTDHALALGLWATGVYDARVLACRVADAAALSRKELDGWLKTCGTHGVSGEIVGLAGRRTDAHEIAAAWVEKKEELVAAAGWSLYALLAGEGELDVETATALLARVEEEIAGAQNRVRYSMNGLVIAIGGYMPALTKAALAAAKRIGPVEVDHGDTDCKTPDAVSYIKKMVARRKKA